MGYFNWFHSIRGHRYLNEKLFFPISSSFPAISGFCGHFWPSWEKFPDFQKLHLYLLLYLKWPSWSHGLNAKIGLKNGPLWAEIFAKMFLNMACQTKPQPHFVLTQLSRPREVRFSNRFLHWDRGIETVILSTMKGTNAVFKNLKILPRSLKNGLKNPKLQEK